MQQAKNEKLLHYGEYLVHITDVFVYRGHDVASDIGKHVSITGIICVSQTLCILWKDSLGKISRMIASVLFGRCLFYGEDDLRCIFLFVLHGRIYM